MAIFERIPPQSIDNERAVLAAMMLNPDAPPKAFAILGSAAHDIFYVEAHQHIYAAMLTLRAAGAPIDVLTVISAIDKMGKMDACGGYSYFSEVTGAVPNSTHVEHYARVVLDKAMLRKAIAACSTVIADAYKDEADVSTVLQAARFGIASVADMEPQIGSTVWLRDALEPAIESLQADLDAKGHVRGVSSGFAGIDNIAGGFLPGQMIVVAARPSVGKTAIALQMTLHAAIQKRKVLYYSYEMNAQRLAKRMLLLQGRIDYQKIRRGFIGHAEFGKVASAAHDLLRADICFVDSGYSEFTRMREHASRHQERYGVDLLVLDHLHLMQHAGRFPSKREEYERITRGIKILSGEMGIPILVLAQLSRAAREGVASISQARETGMIEADCDIGAAITAWDNLPSDMQSKYTSDTVIFDIQKNRDGATGTVPLRFDKPIQRFFEIGGEPEPEPAFALESTPVSTPHATFDEEFSFD